MSIISHLFLTSEERLSAKRLAGDAVRRHGFGAEARLEARLSATAEWRERRVIRFAMSEANAWHCRFDDPDYSPENYRLETSQTG